MGRRHRPRTPVLREGKALRPRGDDDGSDLRHHRRDRSVHSRAAHFRIVCSSSAVRRGLVFRLPAYIELSPTNGTPAIICLDRSAALRPVWMTVPRARRGNCSEVINEGVHYGDASGIVPSSFRIIRMLLDASRATTERSPEWLHASARERSGEARPPPPSRRRV